MTELTAKKVLLKNGKSGEYVLPYTGLEEEIEGKADKEDIANYQPEITTLTATSGTLALAVNKVYSAAISGNTTFSLPTPSNTTVFNQIKVMLKVTNTPTITWGTSRFFNDAAPTIKAGYYDVYFDYDNNAACWVAGAIYKGA